MTKTGNEWYRYPMVWLVIAIPLSAVIVGSIMITLSFTTFDGLVEDDYYKQGKEINQVLARDDFAVDNGISAQITIDDSTGIIAVDLTSTAAYAFPENLGMSFLHPTQSHQDIKLVLSKGPDGRYFSELTKPLNKSRWYLRISEPNWRLQKLISWPIPGEFTLDSSD